MGCVSSSLLNQDEELSQLGSSALGHHIVSLTSTTYGFLTGLDNAPSSPAAAATRFTTTTTTTLFPSPLSESRAIRSEPEVINSWELMAGLDSNDSFRFFPLPNSNSRPSTPKFFKAAKPRTQSPCQAAPADKENCQPNRIPIDESSNRIPKPLVKEQGVCQKMKNKCNDQETNSLELDGLAKVCPPNGEDRVVLYTTTLRGVRRTFEACNAVRSAIQALGFSFSERDISMDRGFRDELNHLRIQHNKLHSSTSTSWAPPRLFIKGSYVGGAEEVLRIHEEGGLANLLQGLPRINPGLLCDGCGGFSFLPCFRCHGSCKLRMALVVSNSKTTAVRPKQCITTSVVIRCPDCNENGLVLCPICT